MQKIHRAKTISRKRKNAVVTFNKEGPAPDISAERAIAVAENHLPCNQCISAGDE